MSSNNQITEVQDAELRLVGHRQGPTASLAIQAMAAMIEKRVSTAKNFPRSIGRFKAEASDLLKNDVETARAAEYAKPVGGGTVKGPSVRLTEIAAMCWGNLECEIFEPVVGESSVSVKASAWDLERNYRQEAIASTPILKKDGGRYPQHMIDTIAAATASKAKRNAIIAIIPRSYINDLLGVARLVAAGNEKPLAVRRNDMIEFFARTYKVTEEQVCSALSVGGRDDIGEEELGTLRGIATGIKEGSSSLEEWFPAVKESPASKIKAKLEERKAAAKKPAEEKAPDNPGRRDELQRGLEESLEAMGTSFADWKPKALALLSKEAVAKLPSGWGLVDLGIPELETLARAAAK